MASRERKRSKQNQLQSQSQGAFHNLELLCKADDRQKKTLEKIIKQKPDLARSLNIYADGVKYYIARQHQRDRLLANKELSPLLEVSEPLTALPLLSQRKQKRQEQPKILSESVERKPRAINPQNYTPFANRQKIYIPSLGPAKMKPEKELMKLKVLEYIQNKFNYYLGNGNNVELVKQILLKRESHWSQVPQQFAYKHFTWQQSYNGMDYQRLVAADGLYSRVMVNFFEFHKNLTSKNGLVIQLLNYFGSIEKTFNIIPMAFLLNFKQSDWLKDVKDFTEYFLANNPLAPTSNKTTLDLDFYMSNLQYSKPNTTGISHYKMADTLTSQTQYLWLLKPSDWNRGEGVHVFSTLEEVESLIKQYYNGKGCYECKEFIIQKYIEKPLLIDNRKFDIRCWVLVTQDQQFYLFKEGYIRTSGQAFSLESKDRMIHLTNNAVQKNAQNYGQFEDGNQLSFEQFQQYLDQSEINKNFREIGWIAIKESVKQTMFSTRMNKRGRKYCMQIFGYDFMIDTAFKTWLIEINANPCIEESSPLLKMLLPRMLDDAFKLTIDKVFTGEHNYNTKYKVNNYQDDQNMWELLGTC